MNLSYFYDNVFYKKSENDYPDEFMNTSYWLIIFAKNILKWIYAVYLLKLNNYGLFFLLFICPFIKFMTIGLGNIYKFKQYFKMNFLIFILFFIVLIESFFQLPSHIIFPKNHIYLHTNYYKIYDLGKHRQIEISCELLENAIIILFLIIDFFKGNVAIVHILSLTFSLLVLVYYLIAEVYYMCFYYLEEVKEVDEYGRTLKRFRNKENKNKRNDTISNKENIHYQNNSVSKEVNITEMKEIKKELYKNVMDTSTGRHLVLEEDKKENDL